MNKQDFLDELDKLIENNKDMGESFENGFEWAITLTAQTVFTGISTFLMTTWNAISSVSSSIWNGISSFLSGLWNGIKSTVKTLAQKIDEPQKVVIPKIVADYIETCKLSEISIFDAMDSINLSNPKEFLVDNWFSEDEKIHQEIFARAWLDGYEVEKEKLYYVNIPNVYHGDFGYSETHDNYSFYSKNDATEIRFELTESEIKQNHEWAWQWAKPVEEE